MTSTLDSHLRILVLNLRDSLNPHAGGAEEHLHQLFSRIAARGSQVTLHCGSFPGAKRDEVVDGIRVIRRGGRLDNAIWSALFYLRHSAEFDVIADYTCQLHFLTPLYVRAPRVAVALHVVGDVYRHDLVFPIGHLMAAWEKFSLRYFYGREHFIAISNSTAAELLSHGISSKRVRVIPGAPALPGPRPRIPEAADPTLVYHGRLKRYKRVDLLLRAMPEILLRLPAAKLRIIGDGDDVGRLRQLATTLGLDDAVSFDGWLPADRHWMRLGSSWVHVQPSMKEGWSLSVLDAAQCGMPTLASRVPSLEDMVEPGVTGELFSPEDVDDYVNKAVTLLQDSSLRRACGQRAAQWASRFTWEDASKRVEDVLAEITGREADEGIQPKPASAGAE
jgi:glycosyltransferase involved in cell wall biosynthesis